MFYFSKSAKITFCHDEERRSNCFSPYLIPSEAALNLSKLEFKEHLFSHEDLMDAIRLNDESQISAILGKNLSTVYDMFNFL